MNTNLSKSQTKFISAILAMYLESRKSGLFSPSTIASDHRISTSAGNHMADLGLIAKEVGGTMYRWIGQMPTQEDCLAVQKAYSLQTKEYRRAAKEAEQPNPEPVEVKAITEQLPMSPGYPTVDEIADAVLVKLIAYMKERATYAR